MRAIYIEPNGLVAEAIGRQLDGAGILYDHVAAMNLPAAAQDAGGTQYDMAIIGGVADLEEHVGVLRRQKDDIVVLILIEDRDSAAITGALRLGADAVLIKPVTGPEIRARAEVALRRNRGLTSNELQIGRMTVFLDGRDPVVDGVHVRFSPRERAIFSVLALHRDQVLSKEQIGEAVYGPPASDSVFRMIDVYISKIRKKIAIATGGDTYIDTVSGRGYRCGG